MVQPKLSRTKQPFDETLHRHLYRSIICLILALATLAVYWQVVGFEFVEFDDPAYVTKNTVVQQGATLKSLIWAFTSVYGSNWHPLTWISHMLDVELFGLRPGMHHLTNVIFHILNTLLLFLVLENMTGALWRSAVVAGLFALHPMHVESVAWVAERKDVLSTFFWMLTMMCYSRFVKLRSVKMYLVLCMSYLLGLMAKPMLVTLPFVLLLLDFWPLSRIKPFNAGDADNPSVSAQLKTVRWQPGLVAIIAEKIPLLVLAAISSGITFYAQQKGGSVSTLENLHLTTRIANAITAYAVYLWKMIWPMKLAAFYPYAHTIDPMNVIVCFLCVGIITGIVLMSARRLPYLPMGWFWYLGTLVPVIGIIQVGHQSMADRYTYIPFIGIFIMISWGAVDVASRLRHSKYALGIVSVIIFALLMASTRHQIGFWKNSKTLFQHALCVTSNNYLAHYDLGNILFDQGDTKSAAMQYQEALQIKPDLIEGHNNLGNILLSNGNFDEAIKHYSESLKTDKHQAKVYNNLGTAYFHKGNILKAIECFQQAVTEKPDYTGAKNNLAQAMTEQKKLADIIAGTQELIKVESQNPGLYIRMGDIYRRHGQYIEALTHYQKAISIQPGSVKAMYGLASVYSDLKDYTNTLAMLQKIRDLQPENPEAYYNIACVYAKQNKIDESVAWLKQAINKGFHNWDMLEKDADLTNIRNTPYMITLKRKIDTH